MSTIHVARGVGTAPTEMASYDAALAAANVHNYNLVTVSSVIPADATVEAVDTAPDLGPVGNRLTVVQARATTGGVGTVSAGIGWTTGPEGGLFYEASGEDPDGVRRALEEGLDAGRELRSWAFDDERVSLATGEADGEGYTTAVVVAAYGQSAPIFC